MRGFREVGWVAAVAGTALSCYMVSLKVASERAALEQVENKIVLVQRDIRVLQTEIGTRGRLDQLESWNVKVLALSAPEAHQFLEGEFQLATLTAPKKTIDPGAPVVLAAAPAPAPRESAAPGSDESGATARDLMQVASLKRDLPQSFEKPVDKAPATTLKAVKSTQVAATTTSKAPAPAAKVAAKGEVAADQVPAKAVRAPAKVAEPAAKAAAPAAKVAGPAVKGAGTSVSAVAAKVAPKPKGSPATSKTTTKTKDTEARQ